MTSSDPRTPQQADSAASLWKAAAAALLFAFASASQAQPAVPAQALNFAKGASQGTATGKLQGPNSDVRDHVLRARAGQTMTVNLESPSKSIYFNVLPPDSEEALYQGEIGGEPRWTGTLPKDGIYRVRVYLNRAASRQRAAAQYTLRVGVQ
ncbi:hypothetical protein WKW79_13500 [Variovorax robiniae]|uniref:DNA breaking-rejoining protein n=1 Tax=Variovorax robiniae TaxID=1836199 RepID=A0ABU8X6Z1_9BURK